jgi:DNA-binding beta-propeller fold protein YncE
MRRSVLLRLTGRLAAAWFVFLGPLSPPAKALIPDHFESPAVHPVEMSADGTRLYVAHTADHRLVVFDLTTAQPTRIAEIQVGIEPVTVRARTASEVWVVNHLSDSISIVDLSLGNVVATLLVGDEPSDVVFAPQHHRAFICISQEDKIRVVDTDDLSLPPVDIPLSMSDPRSLALSPDGETVYVAALDSQNNTTSVSFQAVRTMPGVLPVNPPMRPGLPPPPVTALILKHDGTKWTDEIGRNWNDKIPYQLLDHDVVRISSSTLAVQGAFTGVGTSLFNLAVSPTTGRIFVTNQDAQNEIRFEPNVRGKFLRNSITTIDPGSGTVTSHHLNSHIDYQNPAGNPAERALSLAIPMDVAVSSDGGTVFVTAFGSRKVGVLDSNGNVTRRIVVGDGPCGLALDEARERLYVMNRFTSTLAVVALGPDTVTELPLGFDPTPASIREGRRFLYEGETLSAHGDLACASCHVFGNMDGIAWDLGNPEGDFIRPELPLLLNGFHPMKGPMMTQSLKAMQETGPLHWRGDRPTFLDFNPAFVNLMGRATPIPASDMDLFQEFVFSMRYPPNPNRNLDDTLPPSWNGADPVNGAYLFENVFLGQDLETCQVCHDLPIGTIGRVFNAEKLKESQDVKIPHLRNLYEKTRSEPASQIVRGFGFEKDGTVHDLTLFHSFTDFTFPSESDRLDVQAFLMNFFTGTSSGVGAQWTMDGTNEGAGAERLATLTNMADFDVIGLIAKGRDGADQARGYVYEGAGMWTPDRLAEPPTSTAALVASASAGHEVTFSGVLLGTETRLGIDRDEDGWLDRDELDQGFDPGDPNSHPGRASDSPVLLTASLGPSVWNVGANPASMESRIGFSLGREGALHLDVYDLAGRRVRSLVKDDRHPSGRFESSWDLRDESGRRVGSGTYFVRLESVQGSAQGRVVVLR